MTLPNLIHPVPIEIEPLVRASTIVDPDFREEVQVAARPSRYVVSGQVKWSYADRQELSGAGVEEGADGYVLFRRIDLRAQSLGDPEPGWRFVAFGSGDETRDVDVYVIRVRLEGHYPDRRGATLVKAFFEDRSPYRQTPGGK